MPRTEKPLDPLAEPVTAFAIAGCGLMPRPTQVSSTAY